MRPNMRLPVAGLIWMTACVARAQDLSKPMVLVASPDLAGPYSHTALIVVPMGDRHIGFILNRATESRLATLFPEHAPSAKVTDPLFYGGPAAAGPPFPPLRRGPGAPSLRPLGPPPLARHRRETTQRPRRSPS